MAPALMVCWIEGGAVFFLFSVLARRRRRATGSIAAGTWRRRPSAGLGYSLSLARSDLRRAERSETRRLLGNRSHDLSAKSNSKRTSTRRQLDCTRTL